MRSNWTGDHQFLACNSIWKYLQANFENIHIYNDAICYSTEAILSIDYNSSNATFAYAAGRSIHLWKWSSNYKDIRLVLIGFANYVMITSAILTKDNVMSAMISSKPFRYLTVMNGHLSEVTSIKWHPEAERWISGGDDGQIRYTLKKSGHNWPHIWPLFDFRCPLENWIFKHRKEHGIMTECQIFACQ